MLLGGGCEFGSRGDHVSWSVLFDPRGVHLRSFEGKPVGFVVASAAVSFDPDHLCRVTLVPYPCSDAFEEVRVCLEHPPLVFPLLEVLGES